MFKPRFVAAHPVLVAFDGVNLAIVRCHTKWLGEPPGWERVG